MASRSQTEQQQQSSLDIAEVLKELELKIDRLKVLYEQYFMGIEKMEPQVARKEVTRSMLLLQQQYIRNTAMRFKFNTMLQRWQLYITYWNRTLREIENGTYVRHLAKAKRKAEREGRELPAEMRFDKVRPPVGQFNLDEDTSESRPSFLDVDTGEVAKIAPEGAPDLDLEEVWDQPAAPPSRQPASASASEVPRADVPLLGSRLRPGASPLPPPSDATTPPLRPGATPSPARSGATPLPPPPGATPLPPRPGATSLPPSLGATPLPPRPPLAPPLGATPLAPPLGATPLSPRPGAAPPPLPMRPPPPPSAALLPKIPGMNENELRSLHQRYLDAHKASGAATSVKYETLVNSLAKQVPTVMSRPGIKGVRFDVSVENGRPVLKAIPQK